MAYGPVLAVNDVTVQFGEDVVLNGIDLTVSAGERLCITGRNGSGKSTLLRVLAGALEPDRGTVWRHEAVRVASLEQTLPEGSDVSVYDAVAAGVAERGAMLSEFRRLAEHLDEPGSAEHMADLQQEIERTDGWALDYEIQSVISRLSLRADARLAELSGGWRKRIAIARSLVGRPNVWLLDEPTNHLDIPTVQWLERELLEFEGALVFITHDREMMRSVGTVFVDVGLGQLRRYAGDYRTFLERRDHDDAVLASQARRLDARLAKEEAWLRSGMKARRARNEGRVRMLDTLRARRAERRQRAELHLEMDAGSRSGTVVKELDGVSKTMGESRIIQQATLTIRRGERIGIVGANGAGKSTLIRLLLGELAPDEGQVKTGTRLSHAYYDQDRSALDPERSVADTIADGREYVTINNRDIHAVSYLKSFMFTGDQARAPVRVLSGGEQNRLLLARLFSLPANLLVMDEPTNDLDVDSLELLEQLLLDYTGTVLLVTHDRAFLDNVVDSILVLDGAGGVVQHVGGYTDWLLAGGTFPTDSVPGAPTSRPTQVWPAVSKPSASGTPTVDKRQQQSRDARRAERAAARELERLPARIEELEARIAGLVTQMGEPGFYQQPRSDQQTVFDAKDVLETELETLYARWETLESEVG